MTGSHCRPHSSTRARQSSSSSAASDGDTAVIASAPWDPSVSWATHAKKAESAPPLKATTTGASSSSRARRAASSGIDNLDANALVALALRLGLEHVDAADLVGGADVG